MIAQVYTGNGPTGPMPDDMRKFAEEEVIARL